MNKSFIYGILAATGLVGVYLLIKRGKGDNGGSRSGGLQGINLGIKGDNQSSITVSDNGGSQVIDVNDGSNSSTIVTDFSNSGLSPDSVTTETTSEGTVTTTVNGNTTTVTTVTDDGVTTEEIATEGFVDEPYTRQEVEALYAAEGADYKAFWWFVDNYYTGGYTTTGTLGFLGKAIIKDGNVSYLKPPYYVGQTVYIRQFDDENPKYLDYNGAVQIDGIFQANNGQWMVDTTRSRLGNTPVNGGIICRDDSLQSISAVVKG